MRIFLGYLPAGAISFIKLGVKEISHSKYIWEYPTLLCCSEEKPMVCPFFLVLPKKQHIINMQMIWDFLQLKSASFVIFFYMWECSAYSTTSWGKAAGSWCSSIYFIFLSSKGKAGWRYWRRRRVMRKLSPYTTTYIHIHICLASTTSMYYAFSFSSKENYTNSTHWLSLSSQTSARVSIFLRSELEDA